MGTINNQISRFDISAVYTHPDAKVDIILVHGLNGAPQKTWTAKKNGLYWPTDLLPKTLEDEGTHANIMVYGYNADVESSKHKNPSTNFIHEHAQTLVTYLSTYRKSRKNMHNPIIWVVHSLGGILLKRALEYSDDVRAADQEDLRSIYVSTYAIIFLGTPHEGSDLASWGTMLQGMAGHVPRKFFDSEPVLIRTLRRDNETLENINIRFLDIYQRFKIHMVHENQKTDLRGTRSLIVDSKSAAPKLAGVSSYGIEADHSGMCKFDGVSAPGYRQVSTAIVEWIREAPDTIRVRWTVEEENRRVRTQLEIAERTGKFLASSTSGSPQLAVLLEWASNKQGEEHNNEESSDPGGRVERNETASTMPSQQEQLDPPSPLPLLTQPPPMDEDLRKTQAARPEKEPLFIHPEAFRPNSYFVGREDELKDLHGMLQDRTRRSQGTSTALIRCQTGGGKTHLARQYVFRHINDYPGGVFWLRATSLEELQGEYWRIYRTAALWDLMDKTAVEDLRNHDEIVFLVRRWFESFEDWLLILDGIMFDEPEIAHFVPDRVNTSLILTSTDPAVTGDHHFNNPKLLELPLLDIQDAQSLLLTEMDKKGPWSQEDRSQATELVQLLGRLPLIIHVTAQHLKASREPLASYLKRYRNRPQVGKVEAYELVLKQLNDRGASAALNVMKILVFFDQHVPVEMLALGLRALDRRTPYRTGDATSHGKASLNNTLKVLIAFALVERTECQDISSTSSRSSKKSFDLPSETLDTLRVHNVVQTFFIEHLAVIKENADWLEKAVRVFFLAFEEADKRIKQNPKIGLPDDYRRFCIHGKILKDHLFRYERKSPQLQRLRIKLERTLQEIKKEVYRIQTLIVNQSGEIPQTSVFDRANSLSESDSGTSSTHSQSQPDAWTRVEDGDAELYHSPLAFRPEQLYDTYGLPLPHFDPIDMPGIPYPDEEVPDEEVPDEEVPDEEVPDEEVPDEEVPDEEVPDEGLGSPTPRATPRLGGKADSPADNVQAGRTTVIDSRHEKRQHQRSDSLLNNPRGYHKSGPQVSPSRETAKTPFFHTPPHGGSRASSKGRLSAQSEAELALTKIRRKSPPPPRGGGSIQDRGRSLSSASTTGPKDSTRPGELGYARVASGITPTNERPLAEFSRDFGSLWTGDSSYTAATAQKFMDGPAGRKSGSAHTSPGAEQTAMKPPFIVLPGSRSARSSPGQGASPFYPPGLPVERNSTSSLRRNPPPSLHQWRTESYVPRLGRVESSSLGQDHTAMSVPAPQGRPNRQDFGGGFPPNAWVPTPEAVSAAMSRDSSGQSFNSRNRSAGSGQENLRVTTATDRGRRYSSPISSPVSSVPPSRPLNLPSGISRPPSVVTEPSPRRDPRHDALEPSYGASPPRSRAGSSSSGSGQPQPTSSTTRPSWYKRASGRLVGSRGRAQSASPRPMLRAPASLQGSPELGGTSSGSGGEAMSRSGSGGIMIGDGRLIEFGDVPVNIGLAPRSSSGGVGLGIMPDKT